MRLGKFIFLLAILNIESVLADLYFIERPEAHLPHGARYTNDSGYITFQADRNTVRGYTANGKTLLTEGSNVENLMLTGSVVIDRAAGTDYECGAWLRSIVERDDGSLLGMYHGEKNCLYNPQNLISEWNTFFANSYDGGLTFEPTSDFGIFDYEIEATGTLNGKGNASMVKDSQGTLHIYAMDTTGPWGTMYATSHISTPAEVVEHGRIGDRYTGSTVMWWGPDETLSSIEVDSCNSVADWSPAELAKCPRGGIQLAKIENFTHAESLPFPLLYSPRNQRNTRDTFEIIGSASLVPITGGDRWIKTAYLHYSLTHRHNLYSENRSVRRALRVVPSDDDAGLIRLSTYTNDSAFWTTTNLPTIDFDYLRDEPAYLWTSKQSADMRPVYEVYAPSLNSYLLTRNYTQNISPRIQRVAGWIKSEPATDTVAVYVTYDPVTRKHGITTDKNSDGLFLGYAYPG